MNKLKVYQVSILIVLYLGYGFYYFTRKSITFMLPHFSVNGPNSTSSFNVTKNDIGMFCLFFYQSLQFRFLFISLFFFQRYNYKFAECCLYYEQIFKWYFERFGQLSCFVRRWSIFIRAFKYWIQKGN